MPPRPKIPVSRLAAPQPAVHPFDRLHGTDTSGLLAGPEIAAGTGFAPEDLTAYYGVAPSILDGIVDLWLRECSPRQPIDRTVFLDVGAGKGRALMIASRHPFLRVEGIELNPQLAAIAEANLARWQSDPTADALAPVLLRRGDATALSLPPESTLAYLFHPFESKLLRRFLHRVTASVRASGQPFDLVYVNAEHDSLIDAHPDFRRLWFGRVAMSPDDYLADLAAIADQQEYGSTGDEICAIYRCTISA